MKRWGLLVAVCATALLCACGGRNNPILQLSAQEALDQGKQLLAEGKYKAARPYLIHAFEIEPNSANGREGLLLAADSLYEIGGPDNLAQAEARYKDFLNRFPTSQSAGYAQFQMGNCLARRMVRPDRDQSVAKQALSAYEDVIRLYPGTTYAEQSEAQIVEVRARLAEHDVVVAKFYLRFGIPFAAVQRLEHVLEEYPDYPELEETLFLLCKSYLDSPRIEQQFEARPYCDRLREEYPQSRFVSKIPKKINDIPESLETPADGNDTDTDSAADDPATDTADPASGV